MTTKRALILGVGGQDGSYLAELLLGKDYEVHGLHRRTSTGNLSRVEHLLVSKHWDGKIVLHRGDLLDRTSIVNALVKSQPDEVYNMADQDDVSWSYACPQYSDAVTNVAVQVLLDAVLGHTPHARVYLPLSATIYGDQEGPHRVDTSVKPMSPYARGKFQAWNAAMKYRDLGLHVSCGVLYNHDSPRRGPGYLLQTLCRQAVEVKLGRREHVVIGDPEAVVDVGHARDYAEGAWQLLQHPEPVDLILSTWWSATGGRPGPQTWMVMDWAKKAVREVMWGGMMPMTEGATEKFIEVDQDWRRPYPSPRKMYGDSSEARDLIGWNPKTLASDLVREIVAHWREKLGGGK